MWESLFGSAITPAIQAGIGETAMQTALPAITDEALNAGVNTMLTGGLSNVGTTALGTMPQGVLPTVGQGMFDSLGNFGKALISDQAGNVFKGLGGAYSAYNQGKALDQAKNIQNAQLAMSQDAYNRDKTADQRRQKLVF